MSLSLLYHCYYCVVIGFQQHQCCGDWLTCHGSTQGSPAVLAMLGMHSLPSEAMSCMEELIIELAKA